MEPGSVLCNPEFYPLEIMKKITHAVLLFSLNPVKTWEVYCGGI